MNEQCWQFFIDVGGTFTDVLARRPDGTVVTHKLLSSGVVRGTVGLGSGQQAICDSVRTADPADFWVGYTLALLDADGTPSPPSSVVRFDADEGWLHLDPPLQQPAEPGTGYELRSHEEAPVVAIRYVMGLPLNRPVGDVEVRLGTTRATNALLERKGSRTAFVTTKGFADILKIGYQDRPELFRLNIRKRDELAQHVIEIDERMSATGEVLVAPDETIVRRQFEQLLSLGVEALAICLLHAHVNADHEERIAHIACDVGFRHVSVSSRISRLERIVSRGDTTVVDAYLNPVIQDYVAALHRALPSARIQLMTSSGGLVTASGASGKDTILSGPAGGVVGCAYVTREAGFARTIGFDMGGTSTDVARIEPPPQEFEYQHETVKAGVRIMTPMLAVETVAAGGGSICSFDGQMLTVGPESAGADPGPACYGRGGPLTVTDVNVYVGRVLPDYFPFPLDHVAVARSLKELCDRMEAETETRIAPLALAEGFLQIANANMAAAIKKISIAKGYDAREYALCSFGGAGGQHACAIARMLGLRRICFSPHAGILSALGIGVADIKRIKERSVCELLGAKTAARIEPIFASMTKELREALRSEGIDDEHLTPPRRTWGLCYVGQSTHITVSACVPDDARRMFERRHRQLYGYCHEGRDIEVRVARVELAVRCEAPNLRCVPQGGPETPVARTTPLVVDGTEQNVPLYVRADLWEGMRFTGPAVVVEETSTIVVETGWEAIVRDTGDIILSDADQPAKREVLTTKADPIQLELFNNRFVAIAEQMGTTLRRTALSTNVKERLDFSCALFTATGDLVVNAPHIPVHLGGMSDCVKALIEDVGAFAPGDVYITNDPYRGGSHLNDVTVVTPIHDAAGCALLFFVASRAHHAEIGGTRPGSMPPDSKSLADEGVLIRPFSWIAHGMPRVDALRKLLTAPPHPSRSPDDNLADIAAQVAANQTGVRELHVLVQRYSVEVLRAYMEHIQQAAERKMRAALRRLPDGIHRFKDRLDDGTAICLTLSIDGDQARLDFSGTGAVSPGNLNANRSIVTSAVLYCLRCLIDEDIPLNAGVLAPVEIVLPECLLNPRAARDPRESPAVVGGNVETSQRVVDCVFGALRTVAASQGTMNNLLIGNDRFGYYETICGGAGAGPKFAGADAVHTHMTNTRLTDPEVLESRYPVRLIRFSVRRGSGGGGRFRGGDGVVREFEFVAPLEVSILSQRRQTRPYGLCGGEAGRPGRNLLHRMGAEEPQALPPIASLAVEPGDRLVIETPGGGGYGIPE